MERCICRRVQRQGGRDRRRSEPTTPRCVALLWGLCLLLSASLTSVLGQPPSPNRGNQTQNGVDGESIPVEEDCTLMTDVLQDLDFLSLTVRALQGAGLLETMKSETPFITLLTPTNQAFSNAVRQLGLDSVGDLLQDRAVVRRILEQHIIPAVLDVRSDLQDGQVLLTLDFGNPLLVEWSGTSSTTVDMADYDLSDYYVDDTGEVSDEGVPMIGIRVPPIRQP
eukprot:jgi/Tetstr1/466628/TSEL_011116.t1